MSEGQSHHLADLDERLSEDLPQVGRQPIPLQLVQRLGLLVQQVMVVPARLGALVGGGAGGEGGHHGRDALDRRLHH